MASEYNEQEQADFDRAMTGSIEPIAVNDTKTLPDTYGESNLFSIRSIQFPPDIDSADKGGNQRHFIRFTINIDEESRLIKRKKVVATDADRADQNRFRTGNVSEARFGLAAATAGAAVAGGSSAVAAALGKVKGFGKKAIVTGAAAAVGAGTALLASQAFDVTKKLKKLASTITLYTPGNISSNYQIGYTMTDDMINDILQTDKGAELLKNTETQQTSPVALAEKLTRIIGTNSSSVLSNLTRTAKNPKKDVLFTHVENRVFQFNYVFAPRNAAEAYDVANIIYMFKYFAHPELLEGFDQFLYLFPAEFDIEYIYKAGGEENTNHWVNRISSCVLEGIDIDYAPNGSFQTLQLGLPVLTTMSLRFREIESLHQGRIASGF